jgi:hypothetical protein
MSEIERMKKKLGSMAQNWTMDGNKFIEKWWFA